MVEDWPRSGRGLTSPQSRPLLSDCDISGRVNTANKPTPPRWDLEYSEQYCKQKLWFSWTAYLKILIFMFLSAPWLLSDLAVEPIKSFHYHHHPIQKDLNTNIEYCLSFTLVRLEAWVIKIGQQIWRPFKYSFNITTIKIKFLVLFSLFQVKFYVNMNLDSDLIL